ncbi:hypothetical protein BGW36DRAFT_18778 [Talaromyces proteolyticus]|uniref:AB hydrolase-1 domain-containing protein n=1 Tax=Talaromyces proteolyticus TaxID=1131652 RepID=A0AAD4L665_9EURO|nr:uncharacterized protein BGW36DRAFT_18778 [Talaromyces proteolyticus]KAH8705841.1 hypothetical protein BGW36DRAFT_18778 [Talaromyces proteolyticus]
MATQTSDGLEPRFSLPSSTPLSSKTELVIGGLKVYVYGLKEIDELVGCNQEIAVLYLAHNRTRTYRVMEELAHEVLYRYRTHAAKSQRVGLIALTMNMRNHGDREVFPQANKTWKDGNENHAMDLVSMISGSAHDFKLVVDYLPCYLPQFTRFYNIMAGVSLGGHTAWRIASLAAPGQFHAFAIIVGSPNLASLLLSRLGIDSAEIELSPASTEEPRAFRYDELKKLMTTTQQRRWPLALAEIVHRDDGKVAEDFPSDIPLLLCNGMYDQLVPVKYTATWVEERRRLRSEQSDKRHDNVTFFVQENTGHSCTKEMVAMMAVWLGDVLVPYSRPML